MKGIILAGGSGTRLYPLTIGISKQLLPIYDKPMIYYSLSVLMQAGIRDILIITTPQDQQAFKSILGDGSRIGISIEYKIQPSPDGLAHAFILGEEFLGKDDVCLILGDNIFYGDALANMLSKAIRNVSSKKEATIFGYHVLDPERYGVAEYDNLGKVVSIVEKPKNPKSNFAVTGLYFYPNDVIEKAKMVKPSSRNELEITSLNQMYLSEDRLNLEKLGRGFAWLDTGTHENLLAASTFIETIEARQGLKIACIEEIAFEMGFISIKELKQLGKDLSSNQYGQYLLSRAKSLLD